METPPFFAAPTTNSANPTAAESLDSSPRSRETNSGDADAPPAQKLRLMCSYGGHIVPRPHDKALCYVGGDTRIIVIERYVSLFDLRHHLSKTLLHNQPFVLKYQLPNEDLDSLISVVTDEDLDSMVEEYDRLNNAAAESGRLRVFLFPKTPSNNMEQLLVESASIKSDEWFFNALNCKGSALSAGASDRGFSESSSVSNLLGLDEDLLGKSPIAAKESDPQIEGPKSGNNVINSNSDVNFSVPNSPLPETSSSFGSASSSPPLANLPPLRVRPDENRKAGLRIEDHDQLMNIGVAATSAPGTVVAGYEHPNLVFPDGERLNYAGYRQVPQIQPQVLPIPQFQQKPAPLPLNLATPDSVSSEGSITNPLPRQNQAVYQEPLFQVTTTAATPIDPKTLDQNNPKIQNQESNQPQQFIHGGISNQYIPAVSSYYPIYPSQQQNQQYPFYYVPSRQQTHGGYNIPMQQTNYKELPNMAASRPMMPPPPTVIAPHVVGSGPQYAGFTQIQHLSQLTAPTSRANSNYTEMYYSQALPPHYQNLAMGPGLVVPDASGHVHIENMKQQVRNLQP